MACFLGWLRGESDYELDFPQFLKRFNLLLLPVSTDDIVPGAVLDTGGFFDRGFTYQGHLNELMPRIPDDFWETELNRANLVTGAVSHSVSLRGKSALSFWGVNVSGGLTRARSARVRITGIHARSFADGKGHASILTLRPLLARLKVAQPEAYQVLINDYVVMETFYASECIIDLDANSDANLRAEVELAGGIQVGGEGQAAWKSNSSFVVSQNVEVPFAFSGFRVGR